MLEVAMFEQLDAADQDLFLAILSLCHAGEQIDADDLLDSDGHIRGMPAIQIETSGYELLKRSGRRTGGKDRLWLAQSLKRLSRTSLSFSGQKSEWSVNLLNYSFKKREDGRIEKVSIFVNPIAALVFTGGASVGYIRHSLSDRLSLHGEVAKLLHAYLVGLVRRGTKRVFDLDTLVDRVYSEPAQTERALRKRKTEIRNALKLINSIAGWRVEINRGNVLVGRSKSSR
jgi:hypothetical protein